MTDTKRSILIIDDDKFLSDMYALKFREKGYDVDTAGSAQETLAKMEAGASPDVVLLDIVMPGMDGFELMATINQKKLLPRSTVIILSNLGQREDIDRGMSLGVAGYIVKASATPSEVLAKVTELVSQKKA